jgi:RimJ/RimL family protein N-acetyltransferase
VIELGPTLTTARLVLRPPRQGDFGAWAAVMADEDAARFIGGIQPASVAWRGMASMVGSWALQGFGMFSVLERETGRWIGRVGPHHPHGWPGDEVGWGLAREAWGRGYAREAAIATMDWAFDTLGWREAIHCIDPQNAPSIRLAERLGSVRIGPVKMPAPFEESVIDAYGQSRDDWRRRRAAL